MDQNTKKTAKAGLFAFFEKKGIADFQIGGVFHCFEKRYARSEENTHAHKKMCTFSKKYARSERNMHVQQEKRKFN